MMDDDDNDGSPKILNETSINIISEVKVED